MNFIKVKQSVTCQPLKCIYKIEVLYEEISGQSSKETATWNLSTVAETKDNSDLKDRLIRQASAWPGISVRVGIETFQAVTQSSDKQAAVDTRSDDSKVNRISSSERMKFYLESAKSTGWTSKTMKNF